MPDKTYKIKVDRIIEDLVPDYLVSLRQNIEKIEKYLNDADFSQIRVLGHNMKGSGGGYGMDRISELGKEILEAAKSEDRDSIKNNISLMSDYLDHLEIEYVDQD